MKDQVFEDVARYFLQGKEEIEGISLEKAPEYHPFTRILVITSTNGRKERAVIKVFETEQVFSDKTLPDILNEIAVQQILKRMGFKTREYLLLQSSSDNPSGVPFVISSYIEGETLNMLSGEEVALLTPKMLDYLYRLHSQTISDFFGYLEGRKRGSFGEFESEYLLADIKRDSLIFNSQEMADLAQAIQSLNEANVFCLCHCDATLSNIIWNGSNIHLIDWSYSHFSEPAYDLAYIIFWLLEFGYIQEARKEIIKFFERYKAIGFDIVPRFLFYLAQKCIEFGRVKGEVIYIERGKQLAREVPTNSLGDLLQSITKISSKEK